jgi:hypothetical protein
MVFLAVGVLLCAVALIGAGLEWGRLVVSGRLVVVQGGLSLWQGVTVLVAAAVGALVMALAVARGRGRAAALVGLIAGVVITAVAGDALAWLVTRPEDLADEVTAAAAGIPLKGYVVPPIESIIGAGAWISLVAGALLLVVSLGAVIISAWRGRRGPTTA